jgi:hypothetical protein
MARRRACARGMQPGYLIRSEIKLSEPEVLPNKKGNSTKGGSLPNGDCFMTTVLCL